MTSVLILAAGRSRRLGRPKQTELLGDETLIGRAYRIASEADLGQVHVVLRLGDATTLAAVEQLGCDVIINHEADEGMASSVRAGVTAVASASSAILIMTCDQPSVTAEHLRRLAGQTGETVVASSYGGRRGVPAWFPASVFPELLALRGDQGARELLRDAASVELPGGELDIDTPEELEQARSLFG